MARMSKDEYYLNIAESVIKRSTCIRRNYGAIIVNNDGIVSTGYNGSPRGEVNCHDVKVCYREDLGVPKGERYELCLAVHAEQNAMLSASRREMLGGTVYIVGVNMDGSYANPMPCLLCGKMLKNSGVKRVVGRDTDGTILKINVVDL